MVLLRENKYILRGADVEMARNQYNVDETLKEKFNYKQFKRFLLYLKPYKAKMIITVALMLLSSVLSMITPKILIIILDEYIPNKRTRSLIITCIMLLFLNVIISLLMRIKMSISAQVGQNVVCNIRRDIFNKIQYLPFSFYDDKPHGKIQIRIVNYVNSLSDLITNGIVNTITDTLSLIIIIFFMFSINVRLTCICLLGLPILFLATFIIRKKQRTAWQSSCNKASNINALISESIYGIRTIKSFGKEEETIRNFNLASNQNKKSWLSAVRLNTLLWPIVINVSVFTTAAIYIYGVSCIDKDVNGITIGVIIAMCTYIDRFWAPINTMAGFYNSLITTVSYLERIFETIDEPILVKDSEDAVDIPEIKGSVEFKDLSFGYEENQLILKNVNLQVESGMAIGIVGPTGSGKTTIINLINRFYPVEKDQIFIDGFDISKVTIQSLRRQIGTMMQESFLFCGTVLENIQYGNMDATKEDVIRACKLVHVHEIIMGLDQGYDTIITERGNQLSVGQRQLLCFARVIVSNPKILILDEATSSIDTETEMLLQKGLAEVIENRTSFIIAHRLSTIRQCDLIVYLEDGKIKECGKYDDLLSKQGAFYKLYMSQYAHE